MNEHLQQLDADASNDNSDVDSVLTITYYLQPEAESDAEENLESAQLLGVERLERITEKLIPDYNDNGYKVSVNKFFQGHEEHRWLVRRLVHTSETETAVYLEAWRYHRQEEFLSQTKKSNRTVISKLQFGTLVEVEFGFIPKVKKLNGNVRSNKRYPDTIHNGEMHKRRLCVVVRADSNRVQVVPITSKAPESLGDLTMCQISDDSLRDLVGYNHPTIPSYAICCMIKTVAMTRVLPPRSRQHGTVRPYRSNRYSKRLTSADKLQFKQALSHAVGLSDYFELKERVTDYYQQLKAVNEKCARYVALLAQSKLDN